MSKRFGRNQKRALLKQIETRDIALQMEAGIKRTMRQRLDEQAASLRLVADILGPNFIGLPPQEIAIRDNIDHLSVPHIPKVASRIIDDQQMPELIAHSVRTLEMHTLSATLDQIRGDIHFRYRSRSGEVGYAVSRDTWAGLPKEARYDLCINNISRDMAKLFAENKI